MANKKVSQLTSKPAVNLTDLFLIADPTSGQAFKTTISDLGTAIGSGVSSVNTLVGAVVLDTDDIQELASPTNRWYTDTRSRAAISGGTGISYNSGTGVITNAVTSGQIATALGYTPADGANYLPLAGGTMGGAIFGTIATFASSSSVTALGITLSGASGDGVKITHSAGRAFNIQSSGSGFGILINNETASTSAPFTIQKQGVSVITLTDAGAGTFNSSLTASSFIRTSGTSGQFLKADGSVDSSTYALDSAVVKLAGTQTITGDKAFTLAPTFDAGAGFKNPSGLYNYISATDTGWKMPVNFNKEHIFVLNTSTAYTYTFPSATGTLALTSDLSAYALDSAVVKLTGNQTVAGIKTMSNVFKLDDTLQIKNIAQLSNNTGYTGVWAETAAIGFYTGANAIRLLYAGNYNYTMPSADGTLALTSQLSSYLPLAGGTLTGALSGTSATFSEKINVNSTGTEMVNINNVDNSSRQGIRLNNGINNSSGFVLFNSASSTGTTSSGYFIIDQSSTSLVQPAAVIVQSGSGDILQLKGVSGAQRLTVASTGAATFSSSVTAGGNIYVTNGELYPRFRVTSTNTGSSSAGYELADNTGIQWAIAYDKAGSGLQFFKEGSGNKMYITNSGNVVIGATSFSGVSSGSTGLEVAGTNAQLLINNTGYNHFTIYSATDSNIYNIFGSSGNYLLGTGNKNTSSFAEKMRITSGGYTKASNDGTYYGSTGTYHELRNNANAASVWITNTKTSGTEELVRIKYTAFAPNNSSNWFIYADDSTNARFYVTSAGGIGNYQANNTNLSDERTKKEISPLESYWNKFKALEIVKFKYKDQTHEDFNIGVIAQQVESVAPEFVDVDGWGEIKERETPLKSVYSTDLYHASIGVLKEAMAKIETLEAKIATLENK